MLLVSLHDVTPAYAEEARLLWLLCRNRGVVPALFVVPDWHGRWPLAAHPAFVDWLRDCAQVGADIVLHGYRHDEWGSPRHWRDEIRAWGRTRREGEFLTLDTSRSLARIACGVDALRRLGLAPEGFVAPAWLAREAAYVAAGRVGLRFAEDVAAVRLLPADVRLPAPVVRWSARNPVRAVGSAVIAEARWWIRRPMSLCRIGLHPPDVRRRVTAASLARTLDRWLQLHVPVCYRDVARAASAGG